LVPDEPEPLPDPPPPQPVRARATAKNRNAGAEKKSRDLKDRTTTVSFKILFSDFMMAPLFVGFQIKNFMVCDYGYYKYYA
jgi:hypothetical protein